MNFGRPEPISQGQSLALEPIDLRANGGLHRANFSKLALQRASWQHCITHKNHIFSPNGSPFDFLELKHETMKNPGNLEKK